MIASVSTEFWIIAQFVIIFFLLVFLFFLQRKFNLLSDELLSGPADHSDGEIEEQAVSAAREKIIEMLEPLVEESRKTAILFEDQIKEKKRLIHELNEALDSRIISINLLLSRADSQQKRLEDYHKQQLERPSIDVRPAFSGQTDNVGDQQNQILNLYYQNHDTATIARKLSIPEGEVKLVIDLKEKFAAMENGGR